VEREYARLPLTVQTIYARLLDQLLVTDLGDPAGVTLVSKRIAGRVYWYAQQYVDGKKVQRYLGPETPDLTAVVERWRAARAEASSRAELVAMARAGGAATLPAPEARVLQLLAQVFRIGGVLVGSHAFAVLGNSLGVRWQDASIRTEDVDIAHNHHIDVALSVDVEPLDLARELDRAIPRIPALHPTDPATSFQVRGTQIHVDLLTPLVGRERARTVTIRALNAAATPLRFLDYLIAETQPGVALGGEGTLVNVPRPGRFALHKLLIASRRAGSGGHSKVGKDRAQASAMLRVLLEDLPGEISLAWKALSTRGRGWTSPVRESLARLPNDLVDRLRPLGLEPRR
jgi:hypothetical protein